MIRVTRLNHEPIYVNAELIEYVETTPDTVISLTTGEKFMVLESPDQIVAMVIDYGRQVHQSPDRRLNLSLVSPIGETLRQEEPA
ncbi:MAG: flagellar FlbD family protein [Bryobacterales bacterium]|nr:flagellar FlbD family protein [Bryobacterales bacterium]